MDPFSSRARTRVTAAQRSSTRRPSTDGPSGANPSDATPEQGARRRRTRRLVGALLVAGLAGGALGATGLGSPLRGPDESPTVLADGATVDLSGSAVDAGETLRPEREGDQPSRSEIRDAGGIGEFGAQRRQELAVQEQEAASAEQAQQVADAEAVRRAALAEAEAASAAAEAEAQRVAAIDAALADPRATGRAMAAERGWGGEQFQCLDSLWTKESGWTPTADNPTSSAYGIPQSLPGEKMAADGADWATNPITQISWGLTYIRDVYGTPCGAWAHSRATDWY